MDWLGFGASRNFQLCRRVEGGTRTGGQKGTMGSEDDTGKDIENEIAAPSALRTPDERFLIVSTPGGHVPACAPLSDAERDVARGVLGGLSDVEISERRGVSVHTVRKQLRLLFAKCGVTTRFEFVALVCRNRTEAHR